MLADARGLMRSALLIEADQTVLLGRGFRWSLSYSSRPQLAMKTSRNLANGYG